MDSGSGIVCDIVESFHAYNIHKIFLIKRSFVQTSTHNKQIFDFGHATQILTRQVYVDSKNSLLQVRIKFLMVRILLLHDIKREEQSFVEHNSVISKNYPK